VRVFSTERLTVSNLEYDRLLVPVYFDQAGVVLGCGQEVSMVQVGEPGLEPDR
jgi:hypothetical protein